MWRKLLTQARTVSRIERQLPSTSRSLIGHRRLFLRALSAATESSPIHLNQTTNDRPLLSSETSRFHELDKKAREKAHGKFKAYEDVKDLQKRAVNFTVDDWREFLVAFAAKGVHGGRVYFSSNRLEDMSDIVSRIANFCEHFEPIDYYNFLRLLLTFELSFNDWKKLPETVGENVCAWFMKKYEQLEPSAYFELLLMKTHWLEENRLLAIEPADDVLKFVERGVTLATQSSGISASLRMLHTIECYAKVIDRSLLTPSVDRLLDALTRNGWPGSQNDLCSSLKFIAGLQHRLIKRDKRKRTVTTQDVFQRYACGSRDGAVHPAPKAAWQWLRNSIEMVFDSDQYDHLKQLAAYAAVDAFKYKAVDFSTDELARFLIAAAEPFTKNPAVVMERLRTDVASVPRTVALKLVLAAICRGLLECKDSRLRNLLQASSIRFDDQYWDRFFDILKEEAPKIARESDRRLLLKSLWNLNKAFLFEEVQQLPVRDLALIRKPIDKGQHRIIMRYLSEYKPNKV
uniref:ATPase expression protein 2, mitochondrial n=1 Tax=Plectus sambesii TaxID=2011161 RepID=A0A914XIS6_9BILA